MSAEREADLARVRAAVETLSEHFDTVQIFANRHEPELEGGTVSTVLGAGNWFARYGHVRTWLIREDEDSKESIRKENSE